MILMIILYTLPQCPFCIKVLDFIQNHNIEFTNKNIEDEETKEELMNLCGKGQVPYLVDGEVSMHESDDIIEHLQQKLENKE